MPFGDNIDTNIFLSSLYENTLEKELKTFWTDLMVDMLGSYPGYSSGDIEYTGTYSTSTGGYIRSQGLGTTPHPVSGEPDQSEEERTWNAYKNSMYSEYSNIETYFEDDTNNNNDLTDLFEGNPIGRAGYFSRYADAYYLKLTYYGNEAYLLYDGTQVPLIEDPEVFFNIEDFVDLFDFYKEIIFSGIYSETASNIYSECENYEWYIAPTPEHWGDPGSVPSEVTFDGTYIANIIANNLNYSGIEEPALQNLLFGSGTFTVGGETYNYGYETQISPLDNAQIKSLFTKFNVIGASGGTIITRDFTDRVTYPMSEYPDIENFYINKKLYNVVFSFYNLDYLYPRKLIGEIL